MSNVRKVIAIILTLVMILPYGTFAFGEESDIANHWAKDEIQYLLNKGIVSGYDDGTFKPNKEITRAEFIKIVNGIFGYHELEQVDFNDVKEADWFYTEVAKAVKAGFIEGYDDGTIRPNNFITRQEAAKIIGMVYNLEEVESTHEFLDASQIGNWAIGYVNALKEKGYIEGYDDGTFRPNRPITRAEAVKIIVNASGNIINSEGEYTGYKKGNVVVNTSNVVLKDMRISGDLYLAEGIGEGDVTLDNVTVDGNTYVRGGGENSITIKDSKLGQVVIKKDSKDVRVVFEGNTSVSSIVSGENTRIVIKEGVRVESIKVTGKSNIEVEKGGEVGTIEVEAKDVEIKAEGNIGSLIAKEEVKVNDEVVEKDKEVKIEEGKVEEIEPESEDKEDEDDDRGPSSGGGDGGGGGSPPRDDKDKDDDDEVVPVESVSINYPQVGIEIGQKEQLIATVSPSNATNKKVTWSSSDERVAKVDGNGLVTGVGYGEAIITVKTEDGGKTAECKIAVFLPSPTIVPLEEQSDSVWEDGILTSEELDSKEGDILLGIILPDGIGTGEAKIIEDENGENVQIIKHGYWSVLMFENEEGESFPGSIRPIKKETGIETFTIPPELILENWKKSGVYKITAKIILYDNNQPIISSLFGDKVEIEYRIVRKQSKFNIISNTLNATFNVEEMSE